MPSEISANALTTLARQKKFLQETSSTYDTELERLINAVSVACETYCGTYLSKRTGIVEYHDGKGGYELTLRNIPTTDGALTSIYDDTDREYTAADLIDSDDYVIDLETGRFKRDDEEFASGIHNIKVTYNAGYDTIPADLELAVWTWVAHEYRKFRDKSWPFTNLSSAGETVSYALGQPPDEVKPTLDNYRTVRL